MLNNMTILYVEDDKDTQEVISAILGTIFKEVFTASNGREGIEVYKNSNPDIILTDIGMPIMDGINMSVEIKKINKNQHIIALTAFSEVENLRPLFAAGIDKYMLKPIVDFEDFLAELEATGKLIMAQRD